MQLNKSIQYLLLIAVLLGTLFIRVYYNNTLPVQKRHNYSRYYAKSLQYAIGVQDISLITDKKLKKDIELFLASKLEKLHLESYRYHPADLDMLSVISKTYLGTFNYFVAGLVWKYFGVSWKNLFYFYSLLSTLAALALFMTGRYITKSFYGGLFAAFSYMVATPELYGGVWSIRDASPVWFFAFALTFFFVFLDKYKSLYFNYISYYLFGLITMIGIGWRADALAFSPFFLLLVCLKLYYRYRSNRKIKSIVLALILFLLGNYTIISIDHHIRHKSVPFGFMHVALYGEDARAKLGAYENNFNIRVSDTHTRIQVRNFQKYAHPSELNVPYMAGDYGKYCLELYTKILQHNLFYWVVSYPRYFYKKFISIDTRLHKIRSARYSFTFNPKQNKVLSLLWGIIVYLALLGGLLMFLTNRFRAEVSILFSFILYYSFIYWSIFPAAKHIMIMSVPISILAGLVFYILLKAHHCPEFRLQLIQEMRNTKNIKTTMLSVLSIAGIYLSLLFLSYFYSAHIKQQYEEKIKKLSQHAIPLPSKHVTQKDHELIIDLSPYNQIGVMISFQTTAQNAYVTVIKNKGLRRGKGQLTSTKHRFFFQGHKHTLFSVCNKMGDVNNIHIIFPKNTSILNIKTVSAEQWKDIQYTAILKGTLK